MFDWPPPDPVLSAGQHGGVVASPFKHRRHREAVSAHPAPYSAGNLGSLGGPLRKRAPVLSFWPDQPAK